METAKVNLNKKDAFTLLEVMIVVVIIAIIAAIALPSYSNYVIRSKRADAMGALLSASQAVERFKANNNFSYAGVDTAGVISTQVPADGGTAYYSIGLSNVSASTYTLTATPTGSQPTSDGNLTINEQGAKTWSKNSSNCWPESGGDSC